MSAPTDAPRLTGGGRLRPSGEAIADLTADLIAGRGKTMAAEAAARSTVLRPYGPGAAALPGTFPTIGNRAQSLQEGLQVISREARAVARDACDDRVVDASAIYRSIVARDHPIALYEDHACIAPPWTTAVIGYQNQHGNVHLAVQRSIDYDHDDPQVSVIGERREAIRDPQAGPWEPAQPVEWARVRWIVRTSLFFGGRARGGTTVVPLVGPLTDWYFAVYTDGTPADMHWVNLVGDDFGGPSEWNNALLVVLGVLNFMNCRNVELVDGTAALDRPARRRLARRGVRFHELNVYAAGKSTRRADGTPAEGGQPLGTVRGHFATYGQDGRGLLFGKHAGRFWRPQRARGNAAHGIIDKRYVPTPDDTEVTP